MNKTSILFLIDVLTEVGGAEKNLMQLVTGLEPNKYNITVCCLRGGKVYEEMKSMKINVINLNLGRIYGFRSFIKAIKLIKIIKQEKVRLMVTYLEASDYWGSIVGRISGVPIIISSRRDMGHNLKKRHILMYRVINHLFDKIVVVSEAVREIIIKKEGANPKKIITIYNGVDTDLFSGHTNKNEIREKLGLENNIPVIGILASVAPIKGQRYFIEAIPSVLEEFPGIYFLIIGTCDNIPYYKELKELIKRLQIEKNIIFTGGISDIPGILSIMDICVLSSINEGFPNAVLEYMASSKPVVATNGGGTSEAVVDGETGILVPPRNSNELAKAILKLLKDKQLAESMGKAGKKLTEDLFSTNKMLGNIEYLYDNLLSEKENKEKINLPVNFEIIRIILIRTLKLFIANILYYSGLYYLIKKVSSKYNGINILSYHKINNDDFDPMAMNINVENFERQISYIKKHHNPVSLEQAVILLKERRKIPEDTIVITFDDGYKDNYTNALPILKKYKIPATIFLSVDAINKKKLLWFETIVTAFMRTTKKSVDLTGFQLKKYILNSRFERVKAAREIVLNTKSRNIKERDEIVRLILEQLEVNPEYIELNGQMLNWEDINLMKESDVSFGNHGLTHSILTKLSEEELESEIAESGRIIREKTGKEIPFFSYPNGGIEDFNENIEFLLKKHNYAAACTLISGSNRDTSNLLTLKRLCVTKGMESDIFGNFSKALFATEIGGFYNLLKNKKANYS